MEREHANDKRKWTLTRSNVTALSPAKLVFGRGHIDLFSLDVEGAEMNVRRVLPFGEVVAWTSGSSRRIMIGRGVHDVHASERAVKF